MVIAEEIAPRGLRRQLGPSIGHDCRALVCEIVLCGVCSLYTFCGRDGEGVFCLVGGFLFGLNGSSPEGKRMASGLTRNQVPGNRLRVRIPCPPLRLVATSQ